MSIRPGNRSNGTLAAALLVVLSVSAQAQTSEQESYEPYEPEEFPQWLWDVRRAERTFIGSFPIVMLIGTLAYEGFRGVKNVVGSAPIGERTEFGSFSPDERKWLLVSGLSLSSIVTAVDLAIEISERNRAPERQR